MTETRAFTVTELSRLCNEETARYLRREPYTERFCLELFRRALVQHDEAAWAAVYERYADMVGRWLGSSRGAAEEDVTAAFERFWQAIDEVKFNRFSSLSGILQYLRMCAQTTRIDRTRAVERGAHEQPVGDSIPTHEDVERTATEQVDAIAFWHAVRDALPDERERDVVYLSYAIGLNPSEICARYGARFPDVADVYRIKRNALDRLRRAVDVNGFR